MRQYDAHETMPQESLPSSDLITTGLEDLRRGTHSIPALLVSIGAPRLKRVIGDVIGDVVDVVIGDVVDVVDILC